MLGTIPLLSHLVMLSWCLPCPLPGAASLLVWCETNSTWKNIVSVYVYVLQGFYIGNTGKLLKMRLAKHSICQFTSLRLWQGKMEQRKLAEFMAVFGRKFRAAESTVVATRRRRREEGRRREGILLLALLLPGAGPLCRRERTCLLHPCTEYLLRSLRNREVPKLSTEKYICGQSIDTSRPRNGFVMDSYIFYLS